MNFDYVYYKKYMILEDLETFKKFDLTIKDHLLLMLFIYNNLLSMEELKKEMKVKDCAIRTRISRLCKKTGLKIESKRDYGYRLLSQIKKEGE